MFPPSISLALVVFACCFTSTTVAQDWPQWMGPNRDGHFSASDLVESIPEDGLPVKWRTPINAGYSGPAVQGKRVFISDYRRTLGEFVETPDTPDKSSSLQGFERILCLDATTGEKLWEHEYERNLDIAYPVGSRATPTVKDDLVVMLGAQGDLTVLDAIHGTVKWKLEIPKKTTLLAERHQK